MILTVTVLASLYGLAYSSGVHHAAPIGSAPVVTATSSQYFQRNFNRLVAAPQVVPIAPQPPLFVEPAHALPVHPQHVFPVPVQPIQPFQPVQPTRPVQPVQSPQPVEPNVAIAVATANAAAPVATILLPPYPFGVPPVFGFIPQQQPATTNDDKAEQTTTRSTTPVEMKTTQEPEATTPLPASSDNSFVQALPSNENVGFKQYLAPSPTQTNQHLASPQPQPVPHHHHHHHHHHPNGHYHLHAIPRPQKLRTSVEVVKVPLAYIAPPPLPLFPHNHEAIKVVKHVHTFVPSRAKLIIRPVSHSARSAHIKQVTYAPYAGQKQQNFRPPRRDVEPTTFRPNLRPQYQAPPLS